MVALGQTITVVNQSGKVVKTSKHLVNVFKEAKGAYDEKKAEIKALRRTDLETKDGERRARKQLEALRLDDSEVASRTSASRRPRHRHDDDATSHHSRRQLSRSKSERPPMQRGFSDSFYTNDMSSKKPHRPSPLHQSSRQPWYDEEPQIGELARRHTTDVARTHHHRARPSRRTSFDDIDMDLAYGELPPPLPERKYTNEVELRSKMSGLQRLLDECNCLQHSATATIDHLQKNPDALAAVALSLAEISNLVTKLAPGALASVQSSFPAVIALLASPQFAIAAGVGVGMTIIAFGGYKIVKKIKAKNGGARRLEEGHAYAELPEAESSASEAEELREISRIEVWRRGIAEAEAQSIGTSVEGEFITPVASRTLIEEGRLREADFKSTAKSKGKGRHRKGSGSERSSRSSKAKVSGRRTKESSGLKMLFKTRA